MHAHKPKLGVLLAATQQYQETRPVYESAAEGEVAGEKHPPNAAPSPPSRHQVSRQPKPKTAQSDNDYVSRWGAIPCMLGEGTLPECAFVYGVRVP